MKIDCFKEEEEEIEFLFTLVVVSLMMHRRFHFPLHHSINHVIKTPLLCRLVFL